MYEQIRDAGTLIKLHRQTQPDQTPTVDDWVNALENLMRAAAERDPELAEIVDEILGYDENEE